MLKIVQYPAVRIYCEPVDDNEDVKPIVAEMVDFIEKNKGLGLAGPQVGYNKRLFVIKMPKKAAMVFINPSVEDLTKKTSVETEKCFSTNGLFKVKRFNSVFVHGFDASWNEFRFCFKGLLARAVQYELDHIDGICIKDIGEQVE